MLTEENLPQNKKTIICKIILFILSILFIASLVLEIYLLVTKKNIFGGLLGTLIYVFIATLIIIVGNEEDKEMQKLTNKSMLYYKHRKNSNYFNTGLSIGICVFLGFILSFTKIGINFNIEFLFSISIGLFSLIFVIYTFILPILKKQLNQTYVKMFKLYKNTKHKLKDDKNLKQKQGDVYYNNLKFNYISICMLVSTIIFCISVLFLLISKNIITIVFLMISIVYDLYFIILLANSIMHLYFKSMEDVENLINIQNEKLKINNKH